MYFVQEMDKNKQQQQNLTDKPYFPLAWYANTALKTLFNIVEDRFKNGWTLMSVLYNDVQKGQ